MKLFYGIQKLAMKNVIFNWTVLLFRHHFVELKLRFIFMGLGVQKMRIWISPVTANFQAEKKSFIFMGHIELVSKKKTIKLQNDGGWMKEEKFNFFYISW
jgi:hypothetical protein